MLQQMNPQPTNLHQMKVMLAAEIQVVAEVVPHQKVHQ